QDSPRYRTGCARRSAVTVRSAAGGVRSAEPRVRGQQRPLRSGRREAHLDTGGHGPACAVLEVAWLRLARRLRPIRVTDALVVARRSCPWPGRPVRAGRAGTPSRATPGPPAPRRTPKWF